MSDDPVRHPSGSRHVLSDLFHREIGRSPSVYRQDCRTIRKCVLGRDLQYLAFNAVNASVGSGLNVIFTYYFILSKFVLLVSVFRV